MRGLTLHSLRSQLAYVFEETFLFSESVRANIAYGRPEATNAEIEAAAGVAGAHEFIEALPRGYDTVVGERGLTLSGGQRQRIALARGHPGRPADPRSSTTPPARSTPGWKRPFTTDSGGCWPGRTTLLVAHRRSTLHLADRIVVLEGGRVVESGTHEELILTSPLYRALLSGLEEEDAEAIGDSIEAAGRSSR